MDRPLYPFTAVVGQERAKQALLCLAVEPRIGGVLLCGEKGAAKSTLVRALGGLDGVRLLELPVSATEDMLLGGVELETAVREKVPFVTLIWEDSSYGLIKWKEQEQFGGEDCYVDFSNPDFKLLAEAMHCKGYRVEKADELVPTLEEAFRQDVPSVIVVPVDYSENMKLSEHLKQVCAQK